MYPVIFLHGFCENRTMWSELERALSPQYQTLSIDLPGFGSNPNAVDSIEEMSNYVIRVMNRNGIDEAIVIGHSMGGYVALQMLSDHENRISGLCLFHSHAAADSAEKVENRQKAIDFLNNNSAFAFLKPFSRQLIGEQNRDNAELMNRCLQLVSGTEKTGIVSASRAMMKRADHRKLLQETDTPVLWLIGEEDDFVNLSDVLVQAASTRLAMVEVLDNVGHLAMFEDPGKSEEVLRKFLTWVEEGYFNT